MLRRDFLARCVATPLLVPLCASATGITSNSGKIAYLAAAQSTLGEHSVIALDCDGGQIMEHPIPSRGHSFAMSKLGHSAVIARRPAGFCLILDDAAALLVEIQAREDRHFYGHGVFDHSGEFLYLTENDFANNRGVIGVYQVSKTYQRVAEFESYGVGPHEIGLSTDGSQLIVANGGIETHPMSGRKKLNLESMQPSLEFIDRENGQRLSSARLPAHQHASSIRHIAVSTDDTVYIAMQNQNKSKRGALLAKANFGGDEITQIALPEKIREQLSDYVGDIALDQAQLFLAVSSPYGNSVVIKSLANEQVAQLSIDDVCALSKTSETGQFIASSGNGAVMQIQCQFDQFKRLTVSQSLIADFSGQQHWDNHILVST